MTLSVTLAAVHFLAVGLAFLGSGSRITALGTTGKGDKGGLPAVFAADNVWGISAVLLLATGFARAFAGFEKGSTFYLNNTAFYVKVGLFLSVFALEIVPMVTLIRWRIAGSKGRAISSEELVRKSRLIRRISFIQIVLLVILLFVAATMARGLWMLHRAP